MALTKEVTQDKIEIVSDHKHIQIREKTTIFEGKKVLVTGGTGMIGRELDDLLLDLGANITVVSIDTESVLPDGVEFVYADFRYFDDCISVCHGMYYVFHLIYFAWLYWLYGRLFPKFCYCTVLFVSLIFS